MDNPLDLIGRPYSIDPHPPQSFDCGALVIYVREWTGLKTPFINLCIGADLTQYAEFFSNQKTLGYYSKINEGSVKLFDLVLAGNTKGLGTHHCGIYTPTGVLHAYAGNNRDGSVHFTPHDVFRRFYNLIEFWRLKE